MKIFGPFEIELMHEFLAQYVMYPRECLLSSLD